MQMKTSRIKIAVHSCNNIAILFSVRFQNHSHELFFLAEETPCFKMCVPKHFVFYHSVDVWKVHRVYFIIISHLCHVYFTFMSCLFRLCLVFICFFMFICVFHVYLCFSCLFIFFMFIRVFHVYLFIVIPLKCLKSQNLILIALKLTICKVRTHGISEPYLRYYEALQGGGAQVYPCATRRGGGVQGGGAQVYRCATRRHSWLTLTKIRILIMIQ